MRAKLEDLNNFLRVVAAMLVWGVAFIVFVFINLFKGGFNEKA